MSILRDRQIRWYSLFLLLISALLIAVSLLLLEDE